MKLNCYEIQFTTALPEKACELAYRYNGIIVKDGLVYHICVKERVKNDQ